MVVRSAYRVRRGRVREREPPLPDKRDLGGGARVFGAETATAPWQMALPNPHAISPEALLITRSTIEEARPEGRASPLIGAGAPLT